MLKYIFFSFLLVFSLSCRNKSIEIQQNTPIGAVQSDDATRPDPSVKKAKAPQYVLDVLEYVKQNNKAPRGFVGGRNFQNRENRLPKISNQGAKIKYQEWDVFEKEQGKNRGAERLITGSDKSAWYTKNHYKSFVRIE
jgi:ribonuclease T1